MQSFEFYSPTRIIFGPNQETQVGAQITQGGGHRVLVVYGGQSAEKSGLLSHVLASLDQAGLTYETMGGVRPNPCLSMARQGVAQALSFRADYLLAIGGGSVIDMAKAIAVGAANPQTDVWQLWLKTVPLTQMLPVGAVLTIPAAGSESSDSAVLTNDETMTKRGLGSDLLRPQFAILNPQLCLTLPPYQVACGVVDIMMHTLDRYFNPVCTNELTDALAEGLLRTVIDNGRRAVQQPGQMQPMSELLWAGSLSHNGLTGLGGIKDFAPHQLGHELSAMFDYTHGATLSAIWSSWARYCAATNYARFAQLGCRVWGLDATGKGQQELALQAIQATQDYFTSLHMPVCLSQLECGVLPQQTLEELALRCTYGQTRTIGSFQVLEQQDILKIYQMANH